MTNRRSLRPGYALAPLLARWRSLRCSLAGARWLSVVVGLLTLAALVACGSGTAPRDWASDVCGALTPWRAEITNLNTQAQRQLAQAKTALETRDALVELLAGAEMSSERARTAIEAAGTPDVEGGDQIASRFTATLAGMRDAYGRARADIAVLSMVDEHAFYDSVVAIMTRLNDEYSKAALDPRSLDSPDLKDAFDQVGQCQ